MVIEKPSVEQMKKTAQELRVAILNMVYKAGSGHLGGSFSCCEILTVLYYTELRVDPLNSADPCRDRFILSKGHACPALYAVLAEKGFIPKEELSTLRQCGSRLQGHPDMRKVPGVELSAGSLGMGISFGIGTQIAARLSGRTYRTYVLTGDGELDEGENWEGFLTGAKYKLEDLTVIVDYNKVQLDGTLDEILPLGELSKKISAFKWNVIECDGHDVKDIMRALDEARQAKGRPNAVLAHTVKGKGVSFMENQSAWHGRPPDEKEYERAIAELKGAAL